VQTLDYSCQAEYGVRALVGSRGIGYVYRRHEQGRTHARRRGLGVRNRKGRHYCFAQPAKLTAPLFRSQDV